MILRGSSTGAGLVIGSGGARSVPALNTASYEITLSSNVLNIGHSLTENPSEMLRSFLSQTGGGVAEMHVRAGTNPKSNWNNDTPGAGRPGKTVLGEGNTDAIWLTETSAPIHDQAPWLQPSDTQPWDATNEVFLNHWESSDPETNQTLSGWKDWVSLAVTNGATRAFVYQPWVDLTGAENVADPYYSYGWEARSLIEARLFNNFKTYLETGDHPANNFTDPALPPSGLLGVHIIPSLEFIIHIKGILEAATQPAGVSYTTFETDLFSDDIHLNHHGAYGMACLLYSVIYRTSPVGLPRATSDRNSTPFTTMSVDDAAWWQAEAWSFANGHALTGL